MVIFGLVCHLEKFEKSMVAQTLPFLFKTCKYKGPGIYLNWIYILGFQNKAYQALSRMSFAF